MKKNTEELLKRVAALEVEVEALKQARLQVHTWTTQRTEPYVNPYQPITIQHGKSGFPHTPIELP